ncbi:IS110 family transposase [Streptosporangiaceae bacterium NEAU-GS5]|nr:IS110 family transposase [Streptosporangiaceae bacterium NEAU-GS5]
MVKHTRPDLLQIKGVGVDTAAQLLSTCGDNPDRLASQAAFASLSGVSPGPTSGGKITRYRLNRDGDRQANRTLCVIAVSRIAHDNRTRPCRLLRVIAPVLGLWARIVLVCSVTMRYGPACCGGETGCYADEVTRSDMPKRRPASGLAVAR